MAEGTKDVSADLQQRTDQQLSDRILMVNPETREVQYLEIEQLKNIAALGKQSVDEKDQPNGYAGLDENGILPKEIIADMSAFTLNLNSLD